MKIQLDLPEYNNPGHCEYEVDGFDHRANPCAGCGDELYGLTVRMLPFGWLHAEAIEDNEGKTCQEKAVEKLLADPRNAWVGVARHIAKYPSKHSVSTLRAALTELAHIAETPDRQNDLTAETALAHLADKLAEFHYEVDGAPDREGSCLADGDDWPCKTMRAVYVTQAIKAGA